MKKMHKQILSLVAIILFFILLNVSIYNLFTYRCIPRYSEGMQAKSIELSKFLPFEEKSEIVKMNSDLTIKGDIPVIDGAAALYPVFSGVVNAIYPEDSVEFDGSNFTKESCLQMNNTRGSYKGIVDGAIDIAVCAKPSEEQLEYAKEKGVELELVPIGRESFVFLVNKNNPVDSLTVEQIKGIYTGKYTNWKQLGGENKLISALQRNEGSGSQTAMLSFMGDKEMKKDIDTFLGSSIGYSFRYYVEDVVEEGNIKMLALDGVYPDTKSIKDGTYPIVDNFYAVYRKGDKNENIYVVIDWILSENGQELIEKTGYVGVN